MSVQEISKGSYLSQSAQKMTDHLAENVLNKDMVNLFAALQKSVGGNEFSGVIALLEQTSVLIDIFSSTTSNIESVDDV